MTVRMKALDTIHVSSVSSENIVENQEFDINETEAKQLEERGLAKRVSGKAAKASTDATASASTDKTIIGAQPAPRPAKRK